MFYTSNFFSSFKIRPFGFLSGMRQAYLYFVWLKRLACLTNHSIELTGLCQRRNQMVRLAELFIFQGIYCCKKGKFFILKHKTMFGQPPVSFFLHYLLSDGWILSWNSLHKLSCHTDTTAGHPISTRPKRWMNAKLHTPSKYCKNTNELCTFAVVRQIWPSGQYWKCLQFC